MTGTPARLISKAILTLALALPMCSAYDDSLNPPSAAMAGRGSAGNRADAGLWNTSPGGLGGVSGSGGAGGGAWYGSGGAAAVGGALVAGSGGSDRDASREDAGASGSAQGGSLGERDAQADAAPDASAPADAGEPGAVVRINELNANISKGCDLIELRVIEPGSMAGFELWSRTSALLEFSAFAVQAGDIIVVHLNSDTCVPNQRSEVTSRSESSAPGTYVTAFDWFSSSPGIANTDTVLTLYDARGKIVDAALFSDDPTGTAAAASEEQAAVVARAHQWMTIAGVIPSSGFVDDSFTAHAVQDLDATGTAPSGSSVARAGDPDTNTKSDWAQGASTWGKPNARQR
jgi:hypothetical protein